MCTACKQIRNKTVDEQLFQCMYSLLSTVDVRIIGFYLYMQCAETGGSRELESQSVRGQRQEEGGLQHSIVRAHDTARKLRFLPQLFEKTCTVFIRKLKVHCFLHLLVRG